MAGIMADHNVEGHFVVLLRLWTSDAWRAVWESLQLEVESFERLGIPHDTSDHDLWQLCQRHEIILLTANRNDEGPHSLEATIRTLTVPSSLPVLTIADPELVLASRDYAERVAIQVLQYLLDLDHFRGVGRLFVPWIVQQRCAERHEPAHRLLKDYGCEVAWVFWPYELQINRGEGRHQLARRLFFAHQGAFQTGDYEEIMNKATCLSLLSNAVLVWNTVHMTRSIEQLRAGGETITPEELRRLSPFAFSHVIPNGTYFTRPTTREPDGDPHGPMSPVEVEVAADA